MTKAILCSQRIARLIHGHSCLYKVDFAYRTPRSKKDSVSSDKVYCCSFLGHLPSRFFLFRMHTHESLRLSV